jgi:hypothetical protein
MRNFPAKQGIYPEVASPGSSDAVKTGASGRVAL